MPVQWHWQVHACASDHVLFSRYVYVFTGTHWAQKSGATVSAHLQQYPSLYVLFCNRVAMNLYSQQQIEGLFNQFDLLPVECSEVTYAAMIAARKNHAFYDTIETEVGRDELDTALKVMKQEKANAAAQSDGLDLVEKTSCEKDGGQAPRVSLSVPHAPASRSGSESNNGVNKANACKCGSTTHKRTSHRDCPLNKKKK